jgi:predicted GNAT family N-acyltransferase
MDESKYVIEKLNGDHHRGFFNSGVHQLDDYLTKQAGQDMKRHVAITYVLTELPSSNVIGYHTLSSTSIELKNLPEKEIKRLPRYPLLPATLIGRLAVDENHQGKSIGQFLLIHALKVSLENSNTIASLAVIVDAKNNNSSKFYQYFGFIKFSDIQDKLYLPMETIKKMNFF